MILMLGSNTHCFVGACFPKFILTNFGILLEVKASLLNYWYCFIKFGTPSNDYTSKKINFGGSKFSNM